MTPPMGEEQQTTDHPRGITIDETIVIAEDDVRDVIRSISITPATLAMVIAIAIVGAPTGVFALVSGDTVIGVVLITLVVLCFVSAITSRAVATRSVRAGMPVGSAVRVTADADGFEVHSALGTSSLQYASVRRLVRRRRAIVLRLVTGGASAFPARLLSDDQLAALRAQVPLP